MQEHFYESGSCAQIICAILGVHPKDFGTSLEQNLQFMGRFSATSRCKGNRTIGVMERAMGIEPTSEAWEASILPLYDARSVAFDSTQYCSANTTAAFTKGYNRLLIWQTLRGGARKHGSAG